ncbi:MAG: glycine--tRNA ligase subunit beta [Candidatus Fraserbacteria bacterium RBG_16_55_9]|uniref:Glycine--tRNA ligase beta subunit n=1 Tax=Fraserbacteria sp. (strain RBG_16_55_9) TaxID=1817864 RepID=A0A1F5UVI8_FRAXR|nr:MAG: glycine--tRNA ligase subunit beta [Candidatus Fraserbacteria bacterium RBG_16_55_9]
MLRDLLLEIGTEELPPRESPRLADQLKAAAEELLKEARLRFQAAAVYYTPRRLVLLVKGLDEGQEEVIREIKGPAKRVGLDAQGQPTQAAFGFCRSHSAQPEDLFVKETEEGEYLYVKKTIPGRSTAELLPEWLPQLIAKLTPSETMRWDNSGIRFIRPIRWLLCIFGEETIHFTYGRTRSDNVTYGHRLIGSAALSVRDVREYFEVIEKSGVILDQLERRSHVEASLKKISQKLKARYALSEELWGEIADNLEHPTPILGQIHEEFLKLPREILQTTLVEHQKFVPFTIGERASPYFVGFRDGGDDHDGTVRRGYERVVKARLTDSKFFFESDRKRTLSDRAQELRSVIYQEKLGSIWDKVERMRAIAAEIAKRLRYSELEEIDRTVRLSKADLLTAMVGEFPNLEGIVGGIYAELENEPSLVSRGIYEHHLPKAAGDPVPESVSGIATSLADKIDTLIGSLLLGEEPTGSRDPYGLRRKANGIIQIALDRELDLDFFQLIGDLEHLYAFLHERKPIPCVEDFLSERLYYELRGDYKVAYDVVDAIIATRDGNFHRVLQKARSLGKIRDEERFQSLVIAFSRASNITRGQKAHGFDPYRFQEEAERELWRAYLKAEGQIKQLLPQRDYEGIIERLIALREPIDRYFDDVLVMAPDALVRQNRLGFLAKIVELFLTVGDLSKIVVEGQPSASKTKNADR